MVRALWIHDSRELMVGCWSRMGCGTAGQGSTSSVGPAPVRFTCGIEAPRWEVDTTQPLWYSPPGQRVGRQPL